MPDLPHPSSHSTASYLSEVRAGLDLDVTGTRLDHLRHQDSRKHGPEVMVPPHIHALAEALVPDPGIRVDEHGAVTIAVAGNRRGLCAEHKLRLAQKGQI